MVSLLDYSSFPLTWIRQVPEDLANTHCRPSRALDCDEAATNYGDCPTRDRPVGAYCWTIHETKCGCCGRIDNCDCAVAWISSMPHSPITKMAQLTFRKLPMMVSSVKVHVLRILRDEAHHWMAERHAERELVTSNQCGYNNGKNTSLSVENVVHRSLSASLSLPIVRQCCISISVRLPIRRPYVSELLCLCSWEVIQYAMSSLNARLFIESET